MARLASCHFVPALALTLGLGMQEALGADLNTDGAKHALDLAQGQLQDLTIPVGFVGRLTLQAEGGDGGNGRAKFGATTAFGVGGPGARVIATFDVGPGQDRIPAGSSLRFIIGHKGQSQNEIIVDGVSEPSEASSNSTEAGGGGGGTAVYFGANLLVGAGGGGGGSAIELGPFPIIIPYSADGRYGRYIGDGYGTTLNGGEGGGSIVNSGNGGVYLPLVDQPGWTQHTGGTGGEEGFDSGGGGGTASAGLIDFILFPNFLNPTGFDLSATNSWGGGQATYLNVSLGGGALVAANGEVTYGDGDGGSGWGGGGAGSSFGTGEGGGGGGLTGGGGGGQIGGGGGGGSAWSTGFGARGGTIVARAGQSEARLPQNGSASYTLIPAYTFTPSEISRNADSGTASVQVSATGGDATAPWSAGNAPDWLRINHVDQVMGSGSATLQINFAANTTGTPRTGTITIANRTLTVTQSAEGTGSMSDAFAITANETIPPGFTWNLKSGSVLTIAHGSTLLLAAGSTLENSGTILNEGTLRVPSGGFLKNKVGGKIQLAPSGSSYVGRLYNEGSGGIDNQGAIYAPFGKFYLGNQTTPNPVLENYFYLGIDTGSQALVRYLGGSWDAATQTCTLSNSLIEAGRTVIVGPGVTLLVKGNLYNLGSLINGGTIHNADGVIYNYGSYAGTPPVPNPVQAGEASADQQACESVGGVWNPQNQSCSINTFNSLIPANFALTINPGVAYVINGRLTNEGVIINKGHLSNRGELVNRGSIDNYGEFSNDGDWSGEWPSTIINEHTGIIQNFGEMANYSNISLINKINNNGVIRNMKSASFENHWGLEGGGTVYLECGSSYTLYTYPFHQNFDDNALIYEPCEVTVNLYEPSLDVVLLGGGIVPLRWDFQVNGTEATVSLYHRDYRDITTAYGVLIGSPLEAGLLGATGELDWDVSGLAPGSYSVYAVIRDGDSTAVSAAAGIISILPPGGLTLTATLKGQRDQLTLSWPINDLKGVTVESSLELGPDAVWEPILTPVSETNGQMTVEVPIIDSSRFFRLQLRQ